MTYCYTRKDAKNAANINQFTESLSEKFGIIKATKLKTIAKTGAITAAAAVMGALILMPGSAKTVSTPTPAVLELAGGVTAAESSAATATKESTSYAISENLSYRGFDNAIRDVQIDNAHLGHKLKMIAISDKNPIKHLYYWMERTFSFPAVLVTLAFLITLLSLGFIGPGRDDLNNY